MMRRLLVLLALLCGVAHAETIIAPLILSPNIIGGTCNGIPCGGGGAGTGTVTNVATGSGLTGGPITTTGTINLANVTATSHQWIDSIVANVLHKSQPACGDLSDSATGCSTATGTSGATIPLLNADNTWSGVQSFNSGKVVLKGASSGTLTVNAAATAGSNTLTLPAGTTDFSATGGTSQVVKQVTAGAPFTVARLACSDLSDSGTACTATAGANLALSNLSGVSINTSLLAQTGVDLGGTSNQFRNLYLFGSGTYGTTYIKVTGTPTAGRTITMPDATGTCLLDSTTLATGPLTLGGIGWISSTSGLGTMSFSAALTGLVTGNGTSAPTATSIGTGVATALGVNTGSAGAFVVNGGVLGTPSSGTATNLSGTAASLTAGAVTNATLTTALTVDTGTLDLTGNAANTSHPTFPAGAGTVPYLALAQNWTAVQSGSVETLTISTTTYTPDGAQQNYYINTINHTTCAAAACTFANPSSVPAAGTSGLITIKQDSTGGGSIGTWGSDYITPGGTSTLTLSSGASAIDVIPYFVIDSTHIFLGAVQKNATH